MKLWLWVILAYLVGSFFPLSRIFGLFGGLTGGSKTKTS